MSGVATIKCRFTALPQIHVLALVFLFFVITLCGACEAQKNTTPENLTSGDLFMADTPEAMWDSDTLNLFIIDRSRIHHADYQSLKSNMFLYMNSKQLEQVTWMKTIVYFPDKDNFLTKTYHRDDLAMLLELYEEHPRFRDMAMYMVKQFNATELYNFRVACDAIAAHHGITGGDYIDLLFRFAAESEMEHFEESSSYQLLSEVARMLKYTGMKDYFSEKTIKPDRLIEHLRYFYAVAEHDAPF